VKPCAAPEATGCVVQWNTVLDGAADVVKLASIFQAPYAQKYGDDVGKITLRTNPLTFDLNRREADAGSAKGAIPGLRGSAIPIRLKLEQSPRTAIKDCY
jgi:hypothetical protein